VHGNEHEHDAERVGGTESGRVEEESGEETRQEERDVWAMEVYTG
jgi:hypothetical protein